MADSADPKVDKRTWERHMRNGSLDEKAYDRHIKSLPDVSDKAAPVETIVERTEAEGEGEDDGETLPSGS